MSQMFTYTMEPPYISPKENKDNFYRMPRSILLPPYLADNQYFTDFADTIDEVFDPTLEQPNYALANIRNMWTTNTETMVKINAGQMIDFSEWGGPDYSTVVQQVNLLGLDLETAEIIGDNSYRALSRYIGQYWYEKGKKSTIDFMNFCLDTNLSLTPLWTQDYVTFVKKADIPAGATYIWDAGRPNVTNFYPTFTHSVVGGWQSGNSQNAVGQSLVSLSTPNATIDNPWWPTTHVSIDVTYPSTLQTQSIGKFFYEITNENLVLYSISVLAKTNIATILVGSAGNFNAAVSVESDPYPIAYHMVVGGIYGGGTTGGVGVSLFQTSVLSIP
jgi:hypothetical protein